MLDISQADFFFLRISLFLCSVINYMNIEIRVRFLSNANKKIFVYKFHHKRTILQKHCFLYFFFTQITYFLVFYMHLYNSIKLILKKTVHLDYEYSGNRNSLQSYWFFELCYSSVTV